MLRFSTSTGWFWPLIVFPPVWPISVQHKLNGALKIFVYSVNPAVNVILWIKYIWFGGCWELQAISPQWASSMEWEILWDESSLSSKPGESLMEIPNLITAWITDEIKTQRGISHLRYVFMERIQISHLNILYFTQGFTNIIRVCKLKVLKTCFFSSSACKDFSVIIQC